MGVYVFYSFITNFNRILLFRLPSVLNGHLFGIEMIFSILFMEFSLKNTTPLHVSTCHCQSPPSIDF